MKLREVCALVLIFSRDDDASGCKGVETKLKNKHLKHDASGCKGVETKLKNKHLKHDASGCKGVETKLKTNTLSISKLEEDGTT